MKLYLKLQVPLLEVYYVGQGVFIWSFLVLVQNFAYLSQTWFVKI